MLRIPSTFLFICCMLALRSQWSTDPNVPTPICTATDAQEAVTVLDDGAGGWYVLWRDARLGNNLRQVRGQHVLADGTEAWETDGRLLISHPTKRIWEYAAARFTNGDLGIAYCQGTSFGDSVFVMRFSAQGLPAWSAPSLDGPAPPGSAVRNRASWQRAIPLLSSAGCTLHKVPMAEVL